MTMVRALPLLVAGSLVLALLAGCAGAPATAPAQPAAGPVPPAAAPGSGGASAPVAVSPSTAPPERRTINLGVVNFSALYWPVYVGIAEGLYDRAGFDVEPVVTRSGPDGLAALVGG